MRIISKTELEKNLSGNDKYFLLDTREPDEFEEGHIPKAILAPWHNLAEKINGLNLQTPLILYCNTGVRAQKAAKMLEKAGFTNICVYRGGWSEWSNT